MMDLISKAKLMDHIEKEYAEWGEDYDALQILGDIEDFPSAEPERKKGRWIKEDLTGYLTPGGNGIWHCSECGHQEGAYPSAKLTDFCPDCGAEMRKDND